MFRRPGETAFRDGWDEIGGDLEYAVSGQDYASLARCTQYAHFTPEFIVRAMWSGLMRLGWRGGRVLEPGICTGIFPALMPPELRDQVHVTGIEIDPVTARIARLLQPRARIVNADFARTDMPTIFDLAIGNPPFSDRRVRSDRNYRSMGLRLRDYFIARSIDLLKPGGLAAFVTSAGTMDKADASARANIAKSADLVAARADAGTDVVVDILFSASVGPVRRRATSATDALAVVLNERGQVDVDHIAEPLHADPDAVMAELGEAIYRDPETGAWQTADAYLSGQVRDKLTRSHPRSLLSIARSKSAYLSFDLPGRGRSGLTKSV